MNFSTQSANSNVQSNSSDQNRKIFLGGLSYHTTDESLRKFCSRFGNFNDCLVMRTPEGKSRGFGFVTYETEESVEEFMRARPHTIDSRQIDPKRAMPREDQNRSEAHLTVKKLFVAGLRDGIDENILRDYFSRFGNVVEVLPMKERDGKPRGFAFVSFDDYDAVDKAILAKPHTVNGRTLDIKKAIPKDKMQDLGYPSAHGNNNRHAGSGRNHYQPGPPHRGDSYPNQWDNNDGMNPMGNNSNSNYNQQAMPPYSPPGYRPSAPNYNHQMPSTSSAPYPSSYSTGMGQNQGPSMNSYDPYNQMPPPPPPPPGNNNSNISPYTNPPGSMNNSNYLGSSSTAPYSSMNNSFTAPPVPPPNPPGYNDAPVPPNNYGNQNSYGIVSDNYPGNNSSPNYNPMPNSRTGGPVRVSRGGSSYSGNDNGSNYGQRPSPYPSRGGRGIGRGRARPQ